jgi:hypothetical protein
LTYFQNGNLLEGDPLSWAWWTSDDNYLPVTFYAKKSPSSLSALMHWLSMDPITADGNQLASYDQVGLGILAIGLAFCVLWII